VLGAIIIAGQTLREVGDTPSSGEGAKHACLASIQVLGCSTIVRTVEYFRRSGVDEISVFGNRATGGHRSAEFDSSYREEDAWRSAAQQLRRYQEDGINTVLITRAGAYVECDVAALLEEHCEHGEPVTRTFDKDGPLDMWAVDPLRFSDGDELLTCLRNVSTADCEVGGYVNRLNGLSDVRRLAADILSSRCRMRPHGTETRPGVWMAEGAQVGRGARVVAPAYLGRGARIAEECLVTRCSSVESNSHIDFGTVIEDSSILPDTYVGIGLDITHSVVDGGEVLNLHHGVHLHISDPVVIRRTASHRDSRSEFQMGEMAMSAGEQ